MTVAVWSRFICVCTALVLGGCGSAAIAPEDAASIEATRIDEPSATVVGIEVHHCTAPVPTGGQDYMVYVNDSKYAYWSAKIIGRCKNGSVLSLLVQKGTPAKMLPEPSDETEIFAIDRLTGRESKIAAGALKYNGPGAPVVNSVLSFTPDTSGHRVLAWEIQSSGSPDEGSLAFKRIGGRRAVVLQVSVPDVTTWHYVYLRQTTKARRLHYSLFLTRNCDYDSQAPRFFAGIRIFGKGPFLFRQCFSDKVKERLIITSFQNQVVDVEPAKLQHWVTGIIDFDELTRRFFMMPDYDGFDIYVSLEVHGASSGSSAREHESAFFGPVKD